MSGSGGPVGRREVAVRCFAAEYDDATLEYSEGDDERAPNYVVTPTGTRVNRLFVVGVLTEVESVSDDVLRGRLVDPTGAFVVYAGQYQPDAKAALERTEPPAFVAVTGKARTFRPDDGDRVYTSVRPESVNVVDAETRDRWTVQAGEQTLSRVATAAAALEREERGEALTDVLLESGVDPALAAGLPRALEHYGTTGAYLAAVRTLAIQAAEVVAGERDEVEPLDVAPDEGGTADVGLSGDVTLVATAGGEAGSGQSQEADADAGIGASGVDDVEEAASAAGGNHEGAEPMDDAATRTPEADAGTETVEAGDADEEPLADEAGADELYEMDDDEREAVEAEFGTEFETGNEVDQPGQADMETPGPDEPEEAGRPADAPDEAAHDEEGGEAESAGEPAGADEGDLVDAAVAAMGELDDGDGADRGDVVETVAEDRGVDEAAVEAAIDEALMGGRCYEPDDGRLKAI